VLFDPVSFQPGFLLNGCGNRKVGLGEAGESTWPWNGNRCMVLPPEYFAEVADSP
jgi:hypothetical protein